MDRKISLQLFELFVMASYELAYIKKIFSEMSHQKDQMVQFLRKLFLCHLGITVSFE